MRDARCAVCDARCVMRDAVDGAAHLPSPLVSTATRVRTPAVEPIITAVTSKSASVTVD
jgi:hypothetical protein